MSIAFSWWDHSVMASEAWEWGIQRLLHRRGSAADDQVPRAARYVLRFTPSHGDLCQTKTGSQGIGVCPVTYSFTQMTEQVIAFMCQAALLMHFAQVLLQMTHCVWEELEEHYL